jgi:hypothetical protein
MPTISRTNNPTKVEKIEKGAISIRVAKPVGTTAAKMFYVEHFDRNRIALSPAVKVACVATAGQTAQYFELGTVGELNSSALSLTELATDAAIRFRIIFYDSDFSRIKASADNIRAVDDDGSSPSLVSIEPVPLGGPLWNLELADVTSEVAPVLLVEERLFGTAKAAIGNSSFLSFVLPEVMRKIATVVSENTDRLEDEGSWLAPWRKFFLSINPSAPDEFSDNDDHSVWINQCVKAFCRRGQMSASLEAVLNEADGEST